MKNQIYLRRNNKIIIEVDSKTSLNILPNVYIGTMLKNIEAFGFTFSI